jgi:uncharacterized protein
VSERNETPMDSTPGHPGLTRPLNMRHAEWCPLAEHPLPSTPRDPTLAVQVCDCANQRCQDSYDLGYLTGQLELVAMDGGGGRATSTTFVQDVLEAAEAVVSGPGPVSAPSGFLGQLNRLRQALARHGWITQSPMQRPRIVVLCGSSRFYEQYRLATYQESLAGHIVLSLGFYPRDDRPHWQNNGVTPEQKTALDALHLRKIELADEVLLIAPGGYVGSSTAGELAYARSLGKPIRAWEPSGEERSPVDSRIKSTIRLPSGTYFDYLDPEHSELPIEDIALNLSKLCRYSGGVPGEDDILSVAQHSVLVSELCPPELALAGLLHDAVEAVMADVPGPLKNLCRDYKAIEARIEPVILARFGVGYPLDPRVKQVDLLVMAMEQRDVRKHIVHGGEGGGPWELLRELTDLPDLVITPWPPSRARAAFLARYAALTGARPVLTTVGGDPAGGGDWTAMYELTRQERINARAAEVGLPDAGHVGGDEP